MWTSSSLLTVASPLLAEILSGVEGSQDREAPILWDEADYDHQVHRNRATFATIMIPFCPNATVLGSLLQVVYKALFNNMSY